LSRPRFGIQVVWADGNVSYLRKGAKPGEGPIVEFGSRIAAGRQRTLLAHGLDEGDNLAVVALTGNEPEFDQAMEGANGN
jgi:hypothetical protein